jgi:hypothetical protein
MSNSLRWNPTRRDLDRLAAFVVLGLVALALEAAVVARMRWLRVAGGVLAVLLVVATYRWRRRRLRLVQ